jgi:hypothetical protein
MSGDRLEAGLTIADETRRRLLEALLAEALDRRTSANLRPPNETRTAGYIHVLTFSAGCTVAMRSTFRWAATF